jgi:hypothetical protein
MMHRMEILRFKTYGIENSTSRAGEGTGRVSEGIHEAIDDLIKAIRETARILK